MALILLNNRNILGRPDQALYHCLVRATSKLRQLYPPERRKCLLNGDQHRKSHTSGGGGRRPFLCSCNDELMHGLAALDHFKENEQGVPVVFRFKQRCEFGYEFHVIGDQLALGNWNPLHAVAMEWSDGDVWETVVWLEPNTTLKYKYISKKAGEDNTAEQHQEGVWEGDLNKGNSDFEVEVRPGVGVLEGIPIAFPLADKDMDFMVVVDRFHNENRIHQPSLVLECARKAMQRADAFLRQAAHNHLGSSSELSGLGSTVDQGTRAEQGGVGVTPTNKGAVDQGPQGAKVPAAAGAHSQGSVIGMPGWAAGRNVAERRAAEAGSSGQDPKLVDQHEGSSDRAIAGRSEMTLGSNASVAPNDPWLRWTNARAFHETLPKDVPPEELSSEIDVLCRAWLTTQLAEKDIRELGVYYEAGDVILDDVEDFFRDFKRHGFIFGSDLECARSEAAQRVLKEAAQGILSKMIRCFRKEGSRPLTPLDAFKSIYSAQASDPTRGDSSCMDYVKKSELVDITRVEQFLEEFPDLEHALTMLALLDPKLEFSAVPTFSDGRADYDDVTIDILQQALNAACPAGRFSEEERKPLETFLKCFEDLSARLNEGLFI